MNIIHINFVLIIILILLIYVYLDDNIREGITCCNGNHNCSYSYSTGARRNAKTKTACDTASGKWHGPMKLCCNGNNNCSYFASDSRRRNAKTETACAAANGKWHGPKQTIKRQVSQTRKKKVPTTMPKKKFYETKCTPNIKIWPEGTTGYNQVMKAIAIGSICNGSNRCSPHYQWRYLGWRHPYYNKTLCTMRQVKEPATDPGFYNTHTPGVKTQCKKGHSCPGGLAGKKAPLIKCHAGTYQDEEGKNSCIKCPAGTYSKAKSATSENTCIKCHAGTYQNVKGKSSCAIWPKTDAGYYRKDASRTKSGTNTMCPVGHKCPGGKVGKAAPKIACPAGTYQNQSKVSRRYYCSQCPKGTYSGAGSSNCANWPATNHGYYRIGQSKTKPGKNTKCPVGHKCPGGKVGKAAPKIACPVGTYQSYKGKSSCSNCLAGTYQEAMGKEECSPIRSGYVGKYVGEKEEKYYNINEQGVYDEASTGQVPCPLGYYCNDNKMEKCRSGYYQDKKGKTKCKQIPSGKYGNGVVADFFSNNKIEPFKSIVDCEGGYYCEGGKIGKQVCPIGKYCPKGSHDAKDCSKNSYTNVEGSSKCSTDLDENWVIYKSNSLKCPSGFIPNGQKNDCVIEADWTNGPETHPLKGVVCKPGFKNSNQQESTKYKHNADIEVSCNQGYFGGGKFKCNYGTISGVNYSPKSKSCKPCPEGSFQNEKGKYKCVKCMEGTFQDETGKEKCKLCDINEYQDIIGAKSCNPCPEGEYQDISGAKSCKKFCNYDSTYTQISGPKYDGKIPYGLYEKEKINDINTYYSCDTSGNFVKLSNNDKLKGNSYYCMGSSYTCGKKHLKPEVEYDGTENGFSDSCCSEFPQNKPFQYLNSASCKLTGEMGLEDGYNILDKTGYIEWLKEIPEADNSPNHEEDYSSPDNQIKWNKYVKK